MSSFVVIGAHDKLAGLVDGIIKNRPLNLKLSPCISHGQLIHESGYFYKYSVSGNDFEREDRDKTCELEDLLKNQLAQIRKEAHLNNNLLNIILLENPMSEQEDGEASLFYDCLKHIYDSGQDVNIRIIRACFIYDVEKPTDVSRGIPGEYIKKRKAWLRENDFQQNLLLLSNQDEYAAAICSNKEAHDLMMARMLCDFMMLLSSENNAYNMGNAIQSDTKIFALGFAEAYYYYEDVKRFFEIACEKDLCEALLFSDMDENNSDLDINSFGLNERVERLGRIYDEVSFEKEIDQFPQSIDKKIDDVIIKLEPQIEGYRAKLIAEARECDKKNEKEVCNEYPPYINRKMIYENYLFPDDLETSDNLNSKIEDYKKWLRIIQKREFIEYLKSTSELVCGTNTTGRSEENNPAPDLQMNRGCLFPFLSLFKRSSPKKNSDVVIPQKPSEEPQLSLSQIYIGEISDINGLNKNREKYKEFKKKVDEIVQRLKILQQQIDSFELTKHCKSCDLIIDLSKLKEEQISKGKTILTNTKSKWKNQPLKERTKEKLFKINETEIQAIIDKYKYIHWDKPFSFVKEYVLEELVDFLQKESVPFIHYNTIRDIRENLTSVYLYSDNPEYINPIGNREINIKNINGISASVSNHIASKVCLFQILQVDEQIYEGLIAFNHMSN